MSRLEVLDLAKTLGGAPRQIAANVLSDVALSFDGRRIAYVGRIAGEEKPSLLIAGIGEATEKAHAVLRDIEVANLSSLAWSPDGQLLAMVESRPDPTMQRAGLKTVRVDTGAVTTLGSTRWRTAPGGLAWLPDGSGLLLGGQERTGAFEQIWFVSYPEGVVRKISSGLQAHSWSLSVSGDGKRFVTQEVDAAFNLWIAPKGEDKSAKQITFGRGDGFDGLAWTADEKTTYSSWTMGIDQLWLADWQGEKPRQLTTEEKPHYMPTACSGTNRVFYTSDASGPFEIWSVALEDAQVRQETDSNQQYFSAECSPDGMWFAALTQAKDVNVLFGGDGVGNVARVERGGGKARILFDGDASAPTISPDGQRVAFVYRSRGAPGGPRIGVVSATGGPLEKSFELPPSAGTALQWMPDGHAVAYLDTRGDTTNVWIQPLKGGKPKQLTHFSSLLIANFAWSRDGKFMALSRGTFTSDAVLFTGTR